MAATAGHEEAARSIYARWVEYVRDAREALPAEASLDLILGHAIAEWRAREGPELAFVADELVEERRETRHETAEDELIERVERGELIAVRPLGGQVRYLAAEDYARLDAEERARYLPYDPLLARAIRRYAAEEIPSGESAT